MILFTIVLFGIFAIGSVADYAIEQSSPAVGTGIAIAIMSLVLVTSLAWLWRTSR